MGWRHMRVLQINQQLAMYQRLVLQPDRVDNWHGYLLPIDRRQNNVERRDTVCLHGYIQWRHEKWNKTMCQLQHMYLVNKDQSITYIKQQECVDLAWSIMSGVCNSIPKMGLPSKNGITKHVWYSTLIPMSTTECWYWMLSKYWMLSLGFYSKLGIQCMTAFTRICDIQSQWWHSMSSLGFNPKLCIWRFNAMFALYSMYLLGLNPNPLS